MIGNNKKGFTIVELVVSFGLLTTIIVMAVGIFVVSLRAEKVVLAEQRVAESLNFSLEFMTRQFRLAQAYDDLNPDHPAGCLPFGFTYPAAANPREEIQFISFDDKCLRFYLHNETIMYENITDSPGELINLTSSSDAKITLLNFIIVGEDETDFVQPEVQVAISAESSGGPLEGSVHYEIQTTSTTRLLDRP